jgi:predicted NAD/FAD-dependent oxidoreductase
MHIAVVGAGPVGLTAAHRLRQAGHHVEVLESRDVVGGRPTPSASGQAITVTPARAGWRRSTTAPCPPDWQWGLVCAYGPASTPLLDRPADEVTRELWEAGRAVAPDMFTLEQTVVVRLIHWEWAVPTMGPGHYTRMTAYMRRPPLVLAGDWLEQACVEGAVRSGEAAAAAFGRA